MKNSASVKTEQEIIQEKIEKNTPRKLQVVVVTETGNRVPLTESQFQGRSSNGFYAGNDAKQLKLDTIKHFKQEFEDKLRDKKARESKGLKFDQVAFDSAKVMAEAKFEVEISLIWEEAPVDKYFKAEEDLQQTSDLQ